MQKLQKHIALLLLFAVLPMLAMAQGRKAKREHKAQIEEGWEITLPPIERAPENKIKSRDITPQAVDNWGRRLLLPDDVRNRLATECTKPVKVKILDTGGAYAHKLLKDGQRPGRNYTTSATIDDKQGHGTHVAGIIAGEGFGLAYELVKTGVLTFEGIKVLNDNGSGSFQWFANAVSTEFTADKASIDAGTSVVYNASLGGGTTKVTAVEDAFKRSTDAGVMFFIAAGNTGQPGVQYPGNSGYAITCASIGQQMKVSNFSSRGPEVFQAMPGESITSTYLDGTLADLSGTSMATPFATALSAIALSKWGREYLGNYDRMKKYLQWVCSDLPPNGRDADTGFGVAYVRSVLDKNPKETPSTPVVPVDPPKVDPPTREARLFTVNVADAGKIVWGPTIALPGESKEAQPYVFTGTKAQMKKAGASNTLTVTGVNLSVTESGKAETIIETTESNVKAFFKGRGLVLAQNSDFWDAAYWTAYFLDMAMDREKKQKVVMLGITAKNEAGQTVYLPFASLKQWP